jgi:arginyl-tRNA synthetase
LKKNALDQNDEQFSTQDASVSTENYASKEQKLAESNASSPQTALKENRADFTPNVSDAPDFLFDDMNLLDLPPVTARDEPTENHSSVKSLMEYQSKNTGETEKFEQSAETESSLQFENQSKFELVVMEIAKSYNPKEAEETHYQTWESETIVSRRKLTKTRTPKPFSIVIPPPNVTGSLHMGHALQHTLMDVLTRWKRMQGYKTLFLVGVDHAGISTQLMVTRQLKKDEHKTPQDIGREEFVRRVWAWKEKYGGTITNQIRREGLSVDWSRERLRWTKVCRKRCAKFSSAL